MPEYLRKGVCANGNSQQRLHCSAAPSPFPFRSLGVPSAGAGGLNTAGGRFRQAWFWIAAASQGEREAFLDTTCLFHRGSHGKRKQAHRGKLRARGAPFPEDHSSMRSHQNSTHGCRAEHAVSCANMLKASFSQLAQICQQERHNPAVPGH